MELANVARATASTAHAVSQLLAGLLTKLVAVRDSGPGLDWAQL
jgi:hypothetical protein